jgi:hypothetical protein
MSKKPTYKIGYKKPPRTTQFKKGQSGNKAGRRKGSKNTATILKEELDATVPITENGASKRVSKLRASFKQLANAAAKGDIKAVIAIINTLLRLESNDSPSASSLDVFSTAEDELVMANIVARIRATESSPPNEDPPGHSTTGAP